MNAKRVEVGPDISLPPHLIHRALAALDQAVVAVGLRGEVRYWNTAAERLYGYSAEEAMGRPAPDLIGTTSAALAADWRTQQRPGQSTTGDWQVRDRAGRVFTVSVTATAIVDDDGEIVGMIAVSSDDSNRQREMARSHQLAAMIQGSHDAIVETDLQGLVLHANPAVEKVYGYAPEDLIGRNINVLEAPDNVGATAEAMDDAGSSNGVQLMKARHRDGSLIDVAVRISPVHDETGAVVGLSGITRDVTTEARALAALEASERRFRARFDQAMVPQAMLSLDGRFVALNDAWCLLLRCQRDQLQGTALPKRFHPGDPGDGLARLTALLDGQCETDTWECVLRAADGGEVPVLLHAALLREAGGAPTSVAAFAQDLTGVRATQRKLLRHDALVKALASQASETALVLEANGTVRQASAAFLAEFSANPAQEVLDKLSWDLIHPEDLAAVREIFEDVVATAGRSETVEFRTNDSHGRESWMEVVFTNRLADPDITGVLCTSRDVTARVETTRALRESEAGYRAIAETAQEGIWTADLTGTTWYANQKTADILGVSLSTVYDRNVVELIDPEGSQGVASRMSNRHERGTEQFELSYVRPDASTRTLRFSVSQLHDDIGREGGLAMITDVTDARSAEEQLRRRALHDDLTGLANRTLLDDRLQRAVTYQRRRGHGSVAILFADLDQFKMVNDSLGHAAGDALLIQVAWRLTAAVRAEDTVARFGGDKFVVVCEEAAEPQARELAARLQNALASPFDLDGQPVYISVSVGVAVSPPNTTSELLRSAETAMYAAKSLGRGEIITFDRKLADEGADRLMLSNDLRDALRNDALTLHYQPVVDLNDGRILGVEALARWQHPIHGSISPVTFVGVAEATGLAPALGRWALVRACREAERLCDLIATPPRVAVNISARHLAHPDLEDTVLAAMRGSRLAGGGLVLEITETAVMDNPTQARELLQRLKAFGVEASIDDFGTGYSSLAYLSRLPISTLKIDRSFVNDITTDPDALAITASVIKLAHTMRLHVIAEGIETVEQLGLLRQLGCTSGQGYLFSPGLPPDTFVDMVGRLPAGRFDVTVPEPHPEAGEPQRNDDWAAPELGHSYSPR